MSGQQLPIDGKPSPELINMGDEQKLDPDSGTTTRSASQSPVPVAQLPDSHIHFPDGGWRAWLVVFGGGLATFCSFGFVNAWGVFQAYYSETIMRDLSPSTIAWIGSVQYALTLSCGLIWGRLFDLGFYKPPLVIASVLLVASTFLTAECKEYWQFLLCQGFAAGLASGCVFGPTLAVVAHWFKEKRATAYGLLATGSSIGGTVFPIMIQNLIPKVGFAWTMRIVGFLLIFMLGILNLVMKRRLPPTNVAGGLFNWNAFRYIPFTLYTISAFLCMLGLYTVLTYLDVSANKAGIAPSFDVYFLAIANASSFFGRIVSGMLSDKYGCITVMAPATLLSAIMTYAWPYIGTLGGIVAISICYGFASGVFIALLAVPLIHMGETGDVGRRSGMLFTIISFANLVGTPISGFIAQATGYVSVGWYAGSVVIGGCLLMWYVRYLVTGGKIIGGKF